MSDLERIKHIDNILPQTQCRDCSYDGCMPYAKAIVKQGETIDKCAPGGIEVLHHIARITKQDAAPYESAVLEATRPPLLAVIDETECIGCTKCIQACPVDAIIGTGKLMHSIINDECTGCELCVEPCPVDCIEMQAVPELNFDRENARTRYQEKLMRDSKRKMANAKHHAKATRLSGSEDHAAERKARQDYIAQALARVNTKKAKKGQAGKHT